MANLIEKDSCGHWELKDVPWYDLMIGAIISKDTHDRVYAALCKLKDYEQTGLSPEQVTSVAAGYTADDIVKSILVAGDLQYDQDSYIKVSDVIKIIKGSLP